MIEYYLRTVDTILAEVGEWNSRQLKVLLMNLQELVEVKEQEEQKTDEN